MKWEQLQEERGEGKWYSIPAWTARGRRGNQYSVEWIQAKRHAILNLVRRGEHPKLLGKYNSVDEAWLDAERHNKYATNPRRRNQSRVEREEKIVRKYGKRHGIYGSMSTWPRKRVKWLLYDGDKYIKSFDRKKDAWKYAKRYLKKNPLSPEDRRMVRYCRVIMKRVRRKIDPGPLTTREPYRQSKRKRKRNPSDAGEAAEIGSALYEIGKKVGRAYRNKDFSLAKSYDRNKQYLMDKARRLGIRDEADKMYRQGYKDGYGTIRPEPFRNRRR